MKITSMGRNVQFEYHDPVKNETVTAEDFAMFGGIQIVSGDVTYSISLDENGALIVRPYAGSRLEAVNISPRSSNDLRIWCSLWQPTPLQQRQLADGTLRINPDGTLEMPRGD